MSYSLTIEVPDDLVAETGLPPEKFGDEARFLLASKLYEQGRLSAFQAGKFCGKGRVNFLLALEEAGVPIHYMTAEDAEFETRFIDEARTRRHQRQPAHHA